MWWSNCLEHCWKHKNSPLVRFSFFGSSYLLHVNIELTRHSTSSVINLPFENCCFRIIVSASSPVFTSIIWSQIDPVKGTISQLVVQATSFRTLPFAAIFLLRSTKSKLPKTSVTFWLSRNDIMAFHNKKNRPISDHASGNSGFFVEMDWKGCDRFNFVLFCSKFYVADEPQRGNMFFS